MKTFDNSLLNQLKEDVVATLVRLLVSDARFLEQVDVNVATGELSHVVEVDPDELAKPGRVVVPDGFGIAVRLEDRVGVNNPIFEVGFLLLGWFTIFLFLSLGSSKDGKVGDHFLGVLRFSSSRFAGDLNGSR